MAPLRCVRGVPPWSSWFSSAGPPGTPSRWCRFSLFKNRNFTVINHRGGRSVSVGHPSASFLPITIYLPVRSWATRPSRAGLNPGADVADRPAPRPRSPAGMSDQIGGKFILMTGPDPLRRPARLVLTLQAQADSSWVSFPARHSRSMGLGMGASGAPMATEAMRGVPPMLRGLPRAGVNNTPAPGGGRWSAVQPSVPCYRNQLATTPAR